MRLLETDSLSNQNISSALEIGSYTADAARHVLARVCVDQVAGAGDYIVYATIQRGGTGSAYRLHPTTTATVASGVTAIAFVSVSIPVSTSDVVKIYVDGLAGDTTTPDPTVEWFEVDTLRPTTADRTVLVDANGNVSLGAILGTALTEGAAGRIAAAFQTMLNIAAPVFTVASVNQTGDSFGRIGANGAGLTALALASDVATILAALTTIAGYLDTEVAAILAAVDTEVAAIKLKTDNLPVDPADASEVAALIATAQASLTTIAGYTDTLEASATALAAALALVQGYTDQVEGYTDTVEAGQTTILSKLLKYVQLMTRKDAAIAADNATELAAINANGGSGAGAFVSTTDSQEGIRDAISAGSASAADIAAELAAAGYTVVDTDSVSSSAVSKRRGDLWTVAFTDLGALGTWTKLWLTIKSGYSDPDTAATVQILLTNPGAVGDGLQRLNGAAATAAQGGIVVDDSATGDLTFTVAAVATAQLAPGQYYFDVQILRADGTTTLAEGTWTVRPDATRATS